MEPYIKPILTACYTFPFLAGLFTLPYILHQYRKYGALLLLRIAIVYTFIFYMMTSYFMTILPLPPVDSVTPASATVLLTPFDAVRKWISSSGLELKNPATYLPAFTCNEFLQIAFNILLLFPFGVYLRYYFRRKWYQVLLLSFLYSLFFELTQLSGLYGIYPYPYRFFEVDDLICNTLGGMLGFCATPALLFFLPDRVRLDQMSYKKGEHISAFRRFLAFLLDLGLLGICFMIIGYASHDFSIRPLASSDATIDIFKNILLFPVFSFLLLSLVMTITGGYSIGKYIVRIRVRRVDGSRAGLLQTFARNLILYLFLLPAPVYLLALSNVVSTDTNHVLGFLSILLISILIVVMMIFGLNLLACFVKRNSTLLYDRFLSLSLISTVKEKDALS